MPGKFLRCADLFRFEFFGSLQGFVPDLAVGMYCLVIGFLGFRYFIADFWIRFHFSNLAIGSRYGVKLQNRLSEIFLKKAI